MKLFSTGEASRISGCPQATIWGHVDSGVLSPVTRGRGHGHGHKFSDVQVLALGIGQILKRAGLQGEPVNSIIKMLGRISAKSLQRRFAKGESVLYVIPGHTAMPELVPHSVVSQDVPKVIEHFGVVPIGVHVQAAWLRLQEQAKNQEQQKKTVQAL